MMSSLQRTLIVGQRSVPTDSEGYLENLDDWSEDFAVALEPPFLVAHVDVLDAEDPV